MVVGAIFEIVHQPPLFDIGDNMNAAETKFFELMAKGIYRIDENGQIWKMLRRWKGQGSDRKLIPITPKRVEGTDRYGYIQVTFKIGETHYAAKAHRLVWIHFFGDIPEGVEINHKHGVKTDNRPGELELMTRNENRQHAVDNMLTALGERNCSAKLTEAIVKQCRDDVAAGRSNCTQLARKYGVSRPTMWHALKGNTWKHVR